MGLRSGPFAKMGIGDNRLAQVAGEVLAQVPYRLGDLRSGGFRLGELFLPPLKPLRQARVELFAQAVPLCSCAHLG